MERTGSSNDNLMERVRARMEMSQGNIQEDVISSLIPADILPPVNVEDGNIEETATKRCCLKCFPCSLGIRASIVGPFTLLMTSCVIILVTTQQVLMNRLITTYESACSGAVEQLAAETISFQYGQAEGAMIKKNLMTNEKLQSFYFLDAIELITTTANIIRATEFAVLSPDNQTLLVELALGLQVVSTTFNISTVAMNYLDSETGMQEIVEYVMQHPRNLTLFTYTNVSTLAGNFDNPMQVSEIETCYDPWRMACYKVIKTYESNVSLINQDYLTEQLYISGVETQLHTVWSNFGYFLDPTSISESTLERETWGFTFSYPLALPCMNYTCLLGAFASSLYASTLSTMLYNSLRFYIDSFNSTAVFWGCSGSCVLYEVVARQAFHKAGKNASQVGLLAGGANSSSPFTTGEYVFAFNFTDDPMVAKTTQFVLAQFSDNYTLAIESLKANGTLVFSLNVSSMSQCDFGDEILYNRDLEQALKDCYLVSLGLLQSINDAMFPSYGGITWFTILAMPLDMLMQDFAKALNTYNNQVLQGEVFGIHESARDLLVASLTVGVVLLGVTIIGSWLLGGQLVRPMRRLENVIKRLKRLDFRSPGAHGETAFSSIIEINRVQRALISMFDALKVFARFVPEAVVRNIVKHNIRSVRVKKKEVSIMFSSIVGLHDITDNPEYNIQDILAMFTLYMESMVHIIEKYEGSVAEVGLGLLSFWNTPTDVEDFKTKALCCALGRQNYMGTLNNKLECLVGVELCARIGGFSITQGVHVGECLSGIIGSDVKMKFGAMGDSMNLCSRLEGLCARYGVSIMCSEEVVVKCKHKDSFLFRELDLVKVKGKSIPTRVYELVAQIEPIVCTFVTDALADTAKSTSGNVTIPSEEVTTTEMRRISIPNEFATRAALEERRLRIKTYETSLHLLQRGEFSAALSEIEKITSKLDTAEKYLKTRIEGALVEHGERFDETKRLSWRGINEFTTKTF